MSEESVYKAFLISLGIGAILLGSSVLVAAINLGGAIVSGVMVVIFQVLVTSAAVVLLVAIAGSIASAIYSGIVERMSRLERAHAQLLEALNKRAPTFATSAALIASLFLLLADKSFNGETVPTVCVGIVLAVLFWLANELLVASSRLRNIFGVALWASALVFLPVAFVLHHEGNVDALLQEASDLNASTALLLVLALMVAFAAPIALRTNR